MPIRCMSTGAARWGVTAAYLCSMAWRSRSAAEELAPAAVMVDGSQ